MYNSLLTIVFIAFVCLSHTTEAKSCKGWAKYTLTFKSEWTKQSHPDFPSTAHFSSLVGCSHKTAYVMWIPGGKATTGVKNVAETGAYAALETEMDDQIKSKNAYKRYRVGGFSGGPGTASISNIEVNSEYPLVSFITMIAPSPDWFVGVHDYNLCNTTTGKWVDSRARDLPPYDAGTDSGLNFKSADDVTTPPEDIHILTNNIEGSFKGDKPVKRFGTFTFVKTSENATMTSAPPTSAPPTSAPPTSAPPTSAPPPRGTAHPGTNFNISLVLILCILNIICYLL